MGDRSGIIRNVKNPKIPSVSRLARYLFLLLFGALAGPPVLATNEAEQPVHPSLDQIEALVHREQFAEALLPLANVPSVERSPRWTALVERAAVGHLRTMMRENSAGADAVGEVLLKDYPPLGASPDFLTVYARVVRTNAEACLDGTPDGYPCAERAYRMVRPTSREPGYYLELADLFAKRVSVAVAIPFLQLSEERNRATGNDPAAKLKGCRSDVARRVLQRGFALPPGEPKSAVLAIAGTYCRKTSDTLLGVLNRHHPHVKQVFCLFAEPGVECRTPAKK